MNLRQLRRLVVETVNEETRRNQRRGRKPSKRLREKQLVAEALRLLNEALPVYPQGHPKAGQEKSFEDLTPQEQEAYTDPTAPENVPANISGEGYGDSNLDPDTLGKELEKLVTSGTLRDVVKFLNDAMRSAPDAMKKLLSAQYMGTEDGPWDFDGDIVEEEKDGKTKLKIKGGTGIPCTSILPTQNTIDLMKSLGWTCSDPESLVYLHANPSSNYSDKREEPIAAMDAGDGSYYVLDGHHRWSAQGCMKGSGGNLGTALLKFGSGVSDAEEFLKQSQVGIAAFVMDNMPEQGATAGIPWAKGKGNAASTKSTDGKAYEILSGDGKFAADWPKILGKQNHDVPASVGVMGQDNWWKKLVEQDAQGKLAWLNGFSLDAALKAEYQKIVDYFANGGAENKQFQLDGPGNPAHEAAKKIWAVIGITAETNWLAVKKNPPAWADDREAMPQYGGSKNSYKLEPQGMASLFQKGAEGKWNYAPPYVPSGGGSGGGSGGSSSENPVRTDESIDLRRWSKLAGILKD